MSNPIRDAAETLREFALTLPEAYEDHPWDEIVIKVNKKIFVFFGLAEELDKRLQLGVKLPQSGEFALMHPFVKPSGYNLGKHGWVTVTPPPDGEQPVELLKEWIEESYRAVAPKRLVAQLDNLHSGGSNVATVLYQGHAEGRIAHSSGGQYSAAYSAATGRAQSCRVAV